MKRKIKFQIKDQLKKES